MINSSDISVVIQGSVKNKLRTSNCIHSIRSLLPFSEIILSTWKGSDIQDLDYNILIESKDPGAWYLYDQDSRKSFTNNINRQIVSTKAGLQSATRMYALKFRTDLILSGISFLDYFGVYTERTEEWKILKQRVLVGTMLSINPRKFYKCPYHPSDWVFFGLTEDLINIWDIPLVPINTGNQILAPTKEGYIYEKNLADIYRPEQTIWVYFLKKHGDINFLHSDDISNNNIQVSELTIANNLVILNPEQWKIKFIKYSVLEWDRLQMYSHYDWLQLYKHYCNPLLVLPCNYDAIFKFFKFILQIIKSPLLAFPPILIVWRKKSPRAYKTMRALFQKVMKSPKGNFFSPKKS